MSLNGMTLFELSRGWPIIIKVRHAVMYDVILRQFILLRVSSQFRAIIP